jgi:hypothetical protein
MSHDNEKLWVVSSSGSNKCWVFRTRAAARKFQKDKSARARTAVYFYLASATWGPEQ